MKKSTWKKLFTRSKSKSGTRASKKTKQTLVSCNVCAGVPKINVDTLCSTHRNNSPNKTQDGSPKSAMSTGQNTPSPQPPAAATDSKNSVEVEDKPLEPAAPVNLAQENLEVQESGMERSAPVDVPKPQSLARTSTNEEFMTEEVDSHNLSETLEPVTEVTENNSKSTTSNTQLKASSRAQELQKPSDDLGVSSGLRIRRSGTQMRELASESRGFEVRSQILDNQWSAETPVQESLVAAQETTAQSQETHSEAQRSQSGLQGFKIPSSAKISSAEKIELPPDLNVEEKNRKNSMGSADVDLNSIVLGMTSEPRRESQSSWRPVKIESSNNNEFMSEEVTIGSGTSAEEDEAYISKHDPSSLSRQASSNHNGPQIVEVDDRGVPQNSQRLSTDESNTNTSGNNTTPSIVKGMSMDSSEDLKPGILQAQRSSKLNISFSEHVSLLEDTKGNDEGISNDSLESTEDTTEVTIFETSAVITSEAHRGTLNLGSPSGAESIEALLPPPEDDTTMMGDSRTGSEDSGTSGPKGATKETAIQERTANNARTTPTVIFGSFSGPEQENEWSQPLFFGPNSLAQSLTLNVDREQETPRNEAQGPFQGFGIISIMKDLYENNDSSTSDTKVPKITEVTEEKKKEEEESGESGQAPPSLDDEEQDSFNDVTKKQE